MPESKTPTNKQSKSDFIRAQPAAMFAADVIAKGKAEGMKIGNSLVYMVRARSSVKAKKSAAKTPPTKPTAASVTRASSKSTTPSETPATITSKAAFVRTYASSSAKEVVEKTEAAASSSVGGTSTMLEGRTKRRRK